MRNTILLTALAAVAAASHATIPATLLNDAQANALLVGKTFAAESRMGTNGLSGDFELGLQKPVSGYFATNQRVWTNGQEYDFTLAYDGTTRKIDYTVGGVLTSYTLLPAEVNQVADIFFRLRPANNDSTTSSIGIRDLAINGSPVSNPWLANTANADVYLIKGGDVLAATGQSLASGFTMTGKQTFSWSGLEPQRSNLAYQIKVAAVPEPATLGALAAGVAALMRRRKKA